MDKFNQEQLMLYIYGEASPILQLAIDQSMKDDPALRKEIKSMRQLKKKLEGLNNKASAGNKTIDSILKYADKTKKH